jgi:hypothetical protein
VHIAETDDFIDMFSAGWTVIVADAGPIVSRSAASGSLV